MSCGSLVSPKLMHLWLIHAESMDCTMHGLSTDCPCMIREHQWRIAMNFSGDCTHWSIGRPCFGGTFWEKRSAGKQPRFAYTASKNFFKQTCVGTIILHACAQFSENTCNFKEFETSKHMVAFKMVQKHQNAFKIVQNTKKNIFP